MALRVDDQEGSLREIEVFDGGFSWIAHPDETMQRASHALAANGEVWVVDPVDAAGLDDHLAELGPVAGVVVCLDRHKRDAAALAKRHDCPVYLPEFFDGVAEDLPAETPIGRFESELGETGIEAHIVRDSRFWQEVALYDPAHRTLLVPESVGTAAYFRTGNERLGVHPMRRAFPPRDALEPFVAEPGRPLERVLVGHGPAVTRGARVALREALSGSRRRLPRLYAKNAVSMLPF
ncbi:hypothetical protein [Natronobiforma cellulositropha]|uniref:hypothetical protein n=1 Tax=Natronobiforma cellulositropha TaxID=1679076 RepID=UPI0021D58381|nr:hypothetical protein [Natronobiforma cellulositropha]